MSKILLIDWETLSCQPNAVVTAVAALVVDPTEQMSFDDLLLKCFIKKFDWKKQITQGRHVDPDTVDFWKKPCNDEARKQWVDPSKWDVDIETLHNDLYEYVVDAGLDVSDSSDHKIYSRGNSFEFPIWEDLLRQYHQNDYFKFWNYRDVRTEVDAIAGHLDPTHAGRGFCGWHQDPPNFNKHDPRHDICNDLLMLQTVHVTLAQALSKND